MKIYLAGPMRGRPGFNLPAFHRNAVSLRATGHEVFSPAERDIERHGTDFSAGNHSGDEEAAARKYGFDLRVALGEDPAGFAPTPTPSRFCPAGGKARARGRNTPQLSRWDSR
jgi:hypothetical protein